MLIEAFLRYFEEYYEKFERDKDLSNLMVPYNERLINKGNMVKILGTNEEYVGKALGINKRGGLLVERENGIEMITSGEVSVRGVYGYV